MHYRITLPALDDIGAGVSRMFRHDLASALIRRWGGKGGKEGREETATHLKNQLGNQDAANRLTFKQQGRGRKNNRIADTDSKYGGEDAKGAE